MEVTCANCGNNYKAFYRSEYDKGEISLALKSNEKFYRRIGIDNKLKLVSECPKCKTININDELKS